MSFQTARQLYADLEIFTKKSFNELVDDRSVALFNANLADAKKDFPNSEIISAILPVAGIENYGDLLSSVGQMKALYEQKRGRAVSAVG